MPDAKQDVFKYMVAEFQNSVAAIVLAILLALIVLICIPLPKVQAPTQPKGPVSCCGDKQCEVQRHHGTTDNR